MKEIPEAMIRRAEAHAIREYPDECCGLMWGSREEVGAVSEMRECVNAQNDQHRRDPAAFPRTGRNAYFISPAELLAVDRELTRTRSALRVIYHSHCDADAYFSAEDRRRALLDEAPLFPDTAYLVLAIRDGRPAGRVLFRWEAEKGEFTPNWGIRE